MPMHNILLLIVGTVAFLSAVAMQTPRVGATAPMAPACIQTPVGETTLVEKAGDGLHTSSRLPPGSGCAWRKVCKRW
jgi:hypothetical protein